MRRDETENQVVIRDQFRLKDGTCWGCVRKRMCANLSTRPQSGPMEESSGPVRRWTELRIWRIYAVYDRCKEWAVSHPFLKKSVLFTRRNAGLGLILATVAGGLGGCEVDSFMDPSEVGRMEQTPTIVPVLERLVVVEGGDAANPNTYSTVTPDDLMPEPESYRVAPGDGLDVKIQDFIELGREEKYERLIDDRGFIELPKLGPVFVSGQTGDEAAQTISRAIKNKRLLNDPNVDVNPVQRRKQTYNIMGGVLNPGSYNIPRPDYRLLEAMANGGRFSENVQWVYVIRTVALSTTTAKGMGSNPGAAPSPSTATPGAATPAAPVKKESVIDLIDSLDKPEDKKTTPPAPPGNPGDFGQPVADSAPAKQVPVIDIDAASRQPATSGAQPATASEWQFVNGQWVKGTTGKATGTDPSAGVLTQRVIQIPMQALLNGAAQYNLVVRPGDTVRVQSLAEGIVYVHGNVNRPGVYNLPQTGRMTLIRAIASASDLSDLGVPERVDITRYIGPDRQATVRVNYRAVVEGTQPDLVLRDGDIVNVGTSFWAYPVAVFRNGLRMGWGFDMVLDRNFGYDVFGPQNQNQFN